jgi:hypothetical protein
MISATLQSSIFQASKALPKPKHGSKPPYRNISTARGNDMRGALIGFVAMIAAIPVMVVLRLLKIKHDYDFMDMAGLMIGIIPVVAIPALLLCRFFGLWPFSN